MSSTIPGCCSSSSPSIVLQQQQETTTTLPEAENQQQAQKIGDNSSAGSQIHHQKLPPQPVAHLAAPLIPLRQCRICLLSSESRRKPLLSPCRCAGSVQHVHVHCLAHWIEVSSRKLGPPPQCELCGFRYRRRPFIDITRIHFPFMDLRDRVLNSLCLLLLIIMGLCAWVAVQHLQQADLRRPSQSQQQQTLSRSSNRASRVALSQPDLTVLVAVILMFAALFLAIFTQYRAEVSMFHAISRLWATNRNWRIRNYCPEGDIKKRRRRRGRKLAAATAMVGANENVAAAHTTAVRMTMANFFRGKS